MNLKRRYGKRLFAGKSIPSRVGLWSVPSEVAIRIYTNPIWRIAILPRSGKMSLGRFFKACIQMTVKRGRRVATLELQTSIDTTMRKN
jgi:hypothetical protein